MPHLWPGVLGVFQQTIPVALIGEALRVGQDPGDQATHGVRHRHGRDFSPGENKVSQGDLLIHALVDEPLIDALIVAADQDEFIVVLMKPLGIGLAKSVPAGER